MTRQTARVLSMLTTLANTVYVWAVSDFMVSEAGQRMLTTRGYVFMACTMVASTALTCLIIRYWHSRVRVRRTGKRPAQRQRWRGNEYQGSTLDYSYLREDNAHREAMRRTV